MNERQKRRIRLMMVMLVGLVALYVSGNKIYHYFADHRQFVDHQIENNNKANVYDHIEDLNTLMDCTATVLGRKELITDRERIDIITKIQTIREHEYIHRLIFSKDYNIRYSDFERKFNGYMEGLKMIVENQVNSEEAYGYVNKYHLLLMGLCELQYDLERTVRDESQFNQMGIKDLEESLQVHYVKGKLMFDYLNASHRYFDMMWEYDKYLMELTNTYYPYPTSEEIALIQKEKVKWTQGEIEEIKHELLRRMQILGYSFIAERADSDNEVMELVDEDFASSEETYMYQDYNWLMTLEYQGEEWSYHMSMDPTEDYCVIDIDYKDKDDCYMKNSDDPNLEDKMFKIADLFSEFELKVKRINRPTHIPNIIGGTYSQTIGLYHDLRDDIHIEMNGNGMIRSMYFPRLDQYLGSFDITQTKENSIDQNLQRVEPFIPETIKEILVNITIIRNYDDTLLYQLELKHLDSTLYYYVDYETFKFVEVNYGLR